MGVGRWIMALGLAIAIGFSTIIGLPLDQNISLAWAQPQSSDQIALDDAPNGAKIFVKSCAGCHIGGTNVLVAQKTLEQEALEKFAMDSIDAIQHQVTYGKNAMPAFGKKLSESEVKAVANYVLHQAQSGW